MDAASFKDASQITSRLLMEAGIRHVLIGGQAVRLLGSERRTQDVDVLVEGSGMDARMALAAKDERFRTSNKFLFREIPVEILSGGSSAGLKMSEIASIPIVEIDNVPVAHPSVLVLLKIRRWMHIAESTRPQSVVKATGDAHDILFLLKWLVEHDGHLDYGIFQDDNERKDRVTAGIKLFREMHQSSRDLFKKVN